MLDFMPAGFEKGDRVTYAWDHTPAMRGTVIGPAPYSHNDTSGREDLLVEWDDDGFGSGRKLRRPEESHTLKKLDLITRIGDLDRS